MSLVINIKKTGEVSFTDRKTSIKWDTVEINQALTNQADLLYFEVHQDGSKPYTPDMEDEIVFLQDSVKIFGGFVVKVETRILPGNVVAYRAECRDYTHLLDRKLINKTYENQTEAEIIADILDNYTDGSITYTAVEGPSNIDEITFVNLYASSAIRRLADIFSKDFYIDYDRDFHYFSKEGNTAPFSITDTNGKMITDSAVISKDQTQIRNSITIEGGQELSEDEFFDTIIAPGDEHTFKITYKYKSPTGTIDTGGGPVALTIGSDGLDSFDDYDVLYNYQQDSILFDPLSPPASGAEIKFGGYYYFDITTKVNEPGSISTYGVREYRISERSIKSRELAKERAKAEITAYSSPVDDGNFETYSSGLRTGQRISIQSSLRGLSYDLLIKGVRATLYTPEKFIYSVDVTSFKKFDVMDLLAKIFRDEEVDSGATALRTAEVVQFSHKVARTLSEREFEPTWLAYDLYYPSSIAGDDNRQLWSSGDCVISD